VGFTDNFGRLVLKLGWGKDLVRNYVERGNPDSETRWQRMEKILSEPTQPVDLLP